MATAYYNKTLWYLPRKEIHILCLSKIPTQYSLRLIKTNVSSVHWPKIEQKIKKHQHNNNEILYWNERKAYGNYQVMMKEKRNYTAKILINQKLELLTLWD